MPPALSNLLKNTDALIAKAKGAVAVAAKDIQKEVLYLCKKLDVARSADNREIIYAAVDKRIAKLANKLNQLFQYADDKAVNAANAQAAKSTGVKLQINKHHAKEIIDAVQRAGGENIAATMTANMEANVISSLRGAVVSAMRENALTGGGYKELQAIIRDKWEAAAGSAKGLGFVDAKGRQWDTDAYLNMNVRTNAMRVFNDTLVTQIGRATGGDLVRVSRGGDPSCKLCFPWEGRILSITGKTKGFPTYDQCKASGCFHPNCVHILEPVDEDLDADEVELQRQFPPPKDLADHTAMDEQRYQMDIARKMQRDGLDATAAKIAVDRDNLADSIRNGLIREDADEIVAGMTDEQVNALCPNGNPPEFIPAKDNKGEETWNKGKAGGVVYANGKGLTVDKLLKITDVGEGKPVEPVEPPKLANIFVGNLYAVQTAQATVESARAAIDEAVKKCDTSEAALRAVMQEAKAKWAEVGLDDVFDNAELDKFKAVLDAIVETRNEWVGKIKEVDGWGSTLAALKLPEDKQQQTKNDTVADALGAFAQQVVDEASALTMQTDWSKLAEQSASRLDKELAKRIDTWDTAVTDYLVRLERGRTLRLGWNREIEGLAKKANLGRSWHGQIVAWRKGNTKFQYWEASFKKAATAFTTALPSKDFIKLAKLYEEVTKIWGGTGGGDYEVELAALECVYNEAKRYLEAIVNGQNAPQSAVDKQRDASPVAVDLKPYKFPESLSAKDVDLLYSNGKKLGGTTGARMVELDGRRYMMKLGDSTSNAHVENEMAANAAYRAAGVAVPDCHVYHVDGKTVAMTQFIDGGKSLSDFMQTADDDAKARVVEQLRQHFALDALFANHDVLGTGGDNVLVDQNGTAWRIDNGSAFGFRAQGAEKKDELFKKREWIDDLWTMRGKKPDGQASEIGIPYKKGIYDGEDFNTASILRSARKIDFDAAISTLPEDTRKALQKPLEELKSVMATGLDYERGGYTDGAASIAIDTSYNFQRHGKVRDTIPKLAASNFKTIDPSFRGYYLDEAHKEIIGDGKDLKTYSGNDIANLLIKAAKSVNYHIAQGDFKANESSVSAALETENALYDIYEYYGGSTTKGKKIMQYLKAISALKESKANGFKTAIPNIEATSLTWTEKPQHDDNSKNTKLTLTALVQDYVETDGGTAEADPSRYKIIEKWHESQRHHSWLGGDKSTCKAKILEFRARGFNPDPDSGSPNGEFYGYDSDTKNAYREQWEFYKSNPDQYEKDFKSFMQYKGCVQTILSRTEFEGKQEDGTYLVCRTEKNHKYLGLDEHQGGFCFMQSGSCESTSVFSPFGTYMTVRRLPLSRICSCYFFGLKKDGRGGNKLLLGDNENEITFDLCGNVPVFIYGECKDSNAMKEARKAFLEAEKTLDLTKVKAAKKK